MTRKLDWESRHDERSRNYDVRQLIGVPKVKRRMWLEGRVLDQGSEGACVGFGWTADLLARPDRPKPTPRAEVGNQFARQVYYEAQKVDEWAGEDYEGTSVLAGAKILHARNLIESYWWCFGIEDVRDTVIAQNPVVIGVPWFSSMYYTDDKGMVTVRGNHVGGHCLTLTGYDPKDDIFRWRNSWGLGYGRKGSGYIKSTDLEWLLKNTGEACVPVGKALLVI